MSHWQEAIKETGIAQRRGNGYLYRRYSDGTAQKLNRVTGRISEAKPKEVEGFLDWENEYTQTPPPITKAEG